MSDKSTWDPRDPETVLATAEKDVAEIVAFFQAGDWHPPRAATALIFLLQNMLEHISEGPYEAREKRAVSAALRAVTDLAQAALDKEKS